MTIFLFIPFTTFFLENNYFVSFYVIIHFCRNYCSCYSWGANLDFPIIINQQNAIKRNFCSTFCG